MTPQDQQREFFKKSFTLQGRVFHPHLLQPFAKKEGEAPKFSTMFIWPKNSNPQVMQELTGFIQQATQMMFGNINPAVLVLPIKDPDTYIRQDGKPNPDYTHGNFWVNASSGEKFRPPVVDMNRQPVMDDAEVYSGRNAVINISFYPMTGGKDGQGKRGFGVNINAVMLLEGGAREGGSYQADPNEIFGNFQADMNLIQQGGAAPTAQELQQANQQQQYANQFGGQQNQQQNFNQQQFNQGQQQNQFNQQGQFNGGQQNQQQNFNQGQQGGYPPAGQDPFGQQNQQQNFNNNGQQGGFPPANNNQYV